MRLQQQLIGTWRNFSQWFIWSIWESLWSTGGWKRKVRKKILFLKLSRVCIILQRFRFDKQHCIGVQEQGSGFSFQYTKSRIRVLVSIHKMKVKAFFHEIYSPHFSHKNGLILHRIYKNPHPNFSYSSSQLLRNLSHTPQGMIGVANCSNGLANSSTGTTYRATPESLHAFFTAGIPYKIYPNSAPFLPNHCDTVRNAHSNSNTTALMAGLPTSSIMGKMI